ncbi:D-alanine--D-alanine ligase family protein [Rubinisphaera margarita]|uniref:D-alanine--D-alanine ligase family protein n=1 Tax=Rubinisphaera margarita TaxID=2909586 RepID=UPI001EE87282|nr:D-alanine--D-alanine ligase [Rubinisphaera margarita]MCG6154320.1 D-alanine--D-alanine ligase [Rubinisphaera margarita]
MDVIVLAGGSSAEREISLKSGAAASAALRSRGHTVTVWDPAEVDLTNTAIAPHQLVFIALHGTFGEDGQLQRLLEQRKIRYTGSNAFASELAFQKVRTKRLLKEHGLPTPEWIVHAPDQSALHETETALTWPVVVKPNAQGSSVGISIVYHPDEFAAGVEEALCYDSVVLIENYIAGTEWTVSVFEDVALPPIRIQPGERFYDYEAKYHSPATTYEVVTTEDEVSSSLKTAALQACRLIGTAGLARVDLMLDETGQPWILEVNTLPGLTERSLAPKAAAAIGWSYEDLCERICDCAIGGEPQTDPTT